MIVDERLCNACHGSDCGDPSSRIALLGKNNECSVADLLNSRWHVGCWVASFCLVGLRKFPDHRSTSLIETSGAAIRIVSSQTPNYMIGILLGHLQTLGKLCLGVRRGQVDGATAGAPAPARSNLQDSKCNALLGEVFGGGHPVVGGGCPNKPPRGKS